MADVDGSVAVDFATYEDFLDSQIAPIDLYYLEDEELARKLVELGYRGSGELIKREEFEARKREAEASRLVTRMAPIVLAHEKHEISHSPFLLALAEREGPNREGKLTTIIFLRCRNSKGQEVSGYLDYSSRLEAEDFEQYYSGQKRLQPKASDLSFYNWDTQASKLTASPNFEAVSDQHMGLLFKSTRDRKIINVDPTAPTPGDNTTRIPLKTPEYIQVVFYDHATRRKA